MTKQLFRVLVILIVAGLIWWLGGLIIAAVNAPAIFGSIWLVVVILAALFAIMRAFGVSAP